MTHAPSVSAMISGNRISVTLDGRYRAFDVNTETGKRLVAAVKRKPQNIDEIRKIADITAWMAMQTFGRVVIDHKEQIRLDGEIINSIAAPIFVRLWREGHDMARYVAFIERVELNPNKELVDDLYNFVGKNNITIDDDGFLHLYKRVTEDYLSFHAGREPVNVFYPDRDAIPEPWREGAVECEDGWLINVTGRIPHPVGGWIHMSRDLCDPSRRSACSVGLHACAFDYLRTFHNGNGTIVHVKIDPAELTAFPYDHEAKLRTSKMHILNVIPEQEASDYFNGMFAPEPTPEPESQPKPEPVSDPIDWSARGWNDGREAGADDKRLGYDYDALPAPVAAGVEGIEGAEDIHAYTLAYVEAYKVGWDGAQVEDDGAPAPGDEALDEAWSLEDARTIGEADGYAYATGDTVFDCDPTDGDEWGDVPAELENAYKAAFTIGYGKRFAEEND